VSFESFLMMSKNSKQRDRNCSFQSWLCPNPHCDLQQVLILLWYSLYSSVKPELLILGNAGFELLYIAKGSLLFSHVNAFNAHAILFSL
jgi:hypothetical protein